MEEKKPLILLVEDNTAIHEILCHFLKERFDLKTVSSIDDAVEYIEKSSAVDVLVCDYSLNHRFLSGFDVIRCFQEKFPNSPSILFSANIFSLNDLSEFRQNSNFVFFEKLKWAKMIDFIFGLFPKKGEKDVH